MQKSEHKYSVHKFGGSSLATADRFAALKPLLTGKNEIIVVSAIQGTTTELQKSMDAAKNGEPFLEIMNHLEKKHADLVNTLLGADKGKEILLSIKEDFSEINEMLHSIQLTGACARELQEFILGYGEIWSANILTAYLASAGNVVYLDASLVLFAYDNEGIKCIDWARSQKSLDAFLKDKTFDQIVITGFIASTLEGKRSILGRNGSDFSAAIFAKLFKAQCLTIWTDVDGIYSADPHRVRAAFVIESLSYNEALELAYFGAKVLHPMTIAPMRESGTPIYIKNSYHPEAKGSCISATPEKSIYPIKGLTCIDNISLINIEGTGMIGVSGIAARVFRILHQAEISVILISQASSEHSICFAVAREYTEAAVIALKNNFVVEMERKQIEGVYADEECAIMSAVGDEMVGTIGISGRLCSSLANANINIRAISQGSSERNISVVVNRNDIDRSLQAVHAGFYLSHETLSIGLIGPGLVGSALLRQINTELAHLKASCNVNLYVRGIMSSKKMLLSQEPIDLNHWESALKENGKDADINGFVNHVLAADLPHAVIIDCTANQDIAHHYMHFIEKGIHVITPNKHTNAGDPGYYKKLKKLTQKRNMHYLYEATVCAGLPVINTLQDILKTGDQVLKIEGVVSGTLSYIFNELAKGKTFSECVIEAKNMGYTEPDPREDLSGMDVARKLVCLAREMGHDVTLADVRVHDLVPPELKSCSSEEFLAKLPAYDNRMQELVAPAKAKNEKLCYVAAIDADGALQVDIKSFPAAHAFARMEGTDNMLIFHTRRYNKNPLIIQGPGAGAEVTAAGVFADLLRLVSFLK